MTSPLAELSIVIVISEASIYGQLTKTIHMDKYHYMPEEK